MNRDRDYDPFEDPAFCAKVDRLERKWEPKIFGVCQVELYGKCYWIGTRFYGIKVLHPYPELLNESIDGLLKQEEV